MWTKCVSRLRPSRVHKAHLARPVSKRTFAYGGDAGHHHVATDLSHLERPVFSSDDLVAFLKPEDLAAQEKLLQQGCQSVTSTPFNKSPSEEILSNPLILECLADFASAEYTLPEKHTSADLKALYEQQLENFKETGAPALVQDGVHPIIIQKLLEVYQVRARTPLDQIDTVWQTIGVILGSNDSSERITFNDDDSSWPLWKLFTGRLPGTGNYANPAYRAADQWSKELFKILILILF